MGIETQSNYDSQITMVSTQTKKQTFSFCWPWAVSRSVSRLWAPRQGSPGGSQNDTAAPTCPLLPAASPWPAWPAARTAPEWRAYGHSHSYPFPEMWSGHPLCWVFQACCDPVERPWWWGPSELGNTAGWAGSSGSPCCAAGGTLGETQFCISTCKITALSENQPKRRTA